MKIGDRVIHDYLDNGTVIKVGGLHLVGMCLVKWDKTPAVRYNMGENPCAVWIGELKRISILVCPICNKVDVDDRHIKQCCDSGRQEREDSIWGHSK